MSTPRLAVVSYLGHHPYTPRGTRTRALVEALGNDWIIELHSSSTSMPTALQRRAPVRHARRALRTVIGERLLLDKQEGWSRLRFRTWEPEVDGALLIGWPMSPLVYASARLRAREIPYVIDVGDPWMLTHPDPISRRPVAARATRAERRLWDGASGGVVTTAAQANAISRLYPAVPILVRPNGYETAQPAIIRGPIDRREASSGVLSLVHFGDLYASRVDIGVLLKRLAESGRWQSVEFAQYGNDWSAALDGVPPQVHVTTHEPVSWEKVIAIAQEHDAVVVVGNRTSYQLPSKAIQYLTLPIPRVALTSGKDGDALAEYVAGQPGWLTIAINDPRPSERLYDHVTRSWGAASLAPPPSEAWPKVAEEVAGFVNRVLSTTSRSPEEVSSSAGESDR